MSGIVQTLIAALKAASGATVDAFFNYVSLLLPGNGTNGAQNNTFLDASTNNFAITRNGNTTQGTFTPYGPNWSNAFDGTGDYLTLTNSTALQLTDTTAFTIECWVYLNSTANDGYFLFAQNPSSPFQGYALRVLSGVYVFAFGGTTASFGVSASLHTWTHIAVTYEGSGTTRRFFVNGTQAGAAGTISSSINYTSGTVYIGNNNASNAVNGYISNLRIVKGTALYTTNFTPSTAPLTAITNTSLLTCQSNRFRDASTNNFTITRNGDVSVQRFSPFSPSAAYAAGTIGGSIYFDGNGDYLQTAASTSLQAGTSAFTAEGWIYLTANTTLGSIISSVPDSGGGYGLYLGYYSPTNEVYTSISTNNTVDFSAAVTANLRMWYHVVLVRDTSNNIATFINGVKITPSIGGPTNTTNIARFNYYVHGAQLADNPTRANHQLTGFISDVRFIKGSAAYDPTQSTITVPTAPLTAITNTQLLLKGTNSGIIDNAMMNDLETVGNAQISTAQSKWGGSSIAFDGTGDVLVFRTNPALQLIDTGAFTIECWVYLTSTTNDGYFIFAQNPSSPFQGYSLRVLSGVYTFAFGATTVSSGVSATLNTWTHIAVTYEGSGTTRRFFINGVQAGASGTISSSINYTSGSIYIGGNNASNLMFGYIDDLRITVGVARYTTNFTPPTAAFPTS